LHAPISAKVPTYGLRLSITNLNGASYRGTTSLKRQQVIHDPRNVTTPLPGGLVRSDPVSDLDHHDLDHYWTHRARVPGKTKRAIRPRQRQDLRCRIRSGTSEPAIRTISLATQVSATVIDHKMYDTEIPTGPEARQLV
jgi:hypothetical protein